MTTLRMKFSFVPNAEPEDLPVSYRWGEDGAPDAPTPDEVQMILLFEIADSLKSLEFGLNPAPSGD
jgi:hypothetical protein